jgi:Fe-S cluster biogenesis protein NfuA
MCSGNKSACGLHLRVAEVIEAIRPSIQADGGDIELVELTPEGVVRIRFLQACIGCPSAQITLKHGIEANLQARVPEITGVEAVE